MRKKERILIFLLCFVAFFTVPKELVAEPILNLWMTGEITDTVIELQIQRANTGFSLGGLCYYLEATEPLELSREYTDYGWTANDGIFDVSSPIDVGIEGSLPATISNIRFDTVVNPPGSEFPRDTSDIVEVLTISWPDDITQRWIYFDITEPTASDGMGQDLTTSLGGYINVISGSGLPEVHTYGVWIPEPATVLLLGLGCLGLRRKR